MTATSVLGGSPTPPAGWPREWWEFLSDRWVRWRRTHARAVLIARVMRLCLVVVVVGYLLVALVAVPEIRGGVRVWLWCYWLLIVWYLVARTKTLSWRLYGGLFTVGVVWSVLVGFGSWLLSTVVGGPEGVAVSVGMAPVLEEAAKLVPLGVLAAAAPGRVRRFAVVDWLLAGYCSGLAFLLVEEVARRTGWSVVAGHAGTFEGPGDVRFGLSPLSGGAVAGDWPQVLAVTPGHHVHTALVAVAVGVAVACWRRSQRSWRHPLSWRILALALPVLTWTTAVVDHAGWNAFAVSGAFWTDAPTFPLALRLGWQVTGQGAGRGALLVLALVVAMLVDARRMYRADAGRPLDPDRPWTGLGWMHQVPGEVATWTRDLRARSAPMFSTFLRSFGAVLTACCLWSGYAYRDLAVIWSEPFTSGGPRDRLTRWLRALSVTRDARQLAQSQAPAAYRPGPSRLLAVIACLLLAALAVPVALSLVQALQASAHAAPPLGNWLGGTLSRLGPWWERLAGWQKTLLAISAVAIPFSGQSVLSPLQDTPKGGSGRPIAITVPRGGGLTNFFRRLFRPNGPWKRPRGDNAWTGSDRTTKELKASGEVKFPLDKRQDLTRAGQALNKHGKDQRPGHDIFPEARGNVTNKNRVGQQVVDDVLDDPKTLERRITNKRSKFYGGTYYIAPDGRTLAYDEYGVLQYFGVMDYPG